MKRACLIVLDGFGERAATDGNAIRLAKTPTFDALYREWPHTVVHTSGLAVGLSSPAAGATGVRYRVRFTVSTNGGLAANAGTVRIVAPAGTVLPSSGAQYELTDLETGTFKSSLPVALSGGGTIATVTTGFDLPGGHRAQLVVSNITNVILSPTAYSQI